MRKSTTRGFRHGASLIAPRVRQVSESRGFAVSRVLTHWAEVAGDDLASVTRPVRVSHTRHAFGATLTLLTSGTQAPLVEMQKEALRARVNAVYGYNAIARIVVTQTAPEGFANGQIEFESPQEDKPQVQPDDDTPTDAARRLAGPIGDPGLRTALERLGSRILTQSNTEQEKVET